MNTNIMKKTNAGFLLLPLTVSALALALVLTPAWSDDPRTVQTADAPAHINEGSPSCPYAQSSSQDSAALARHQAWLLVHIHAGMTERAAQPVYSGPSLQLISSRDFTGEHDANNARNISF